MACTWKSDAIQPLVSTTRTSVASRLRSLLVKSSAAPAPGKLGGKML
jgi:hypothetical protein